MSSVLEDSDVDLRTMTVSNIMGKDGPDTQSAIRLLSKALDDRSDRVRGLAERALATRGESISDDEAEQFENQLAGSDDELATRILLLGYYFLGKWRFPSARRARQQHILWLIEYAPRSETAGTPYVCLVGEDDAECYAQAKQLWLVQVESHPHDTAVLGNAASFFVLQDKELSTSLLQTARALEPRNPEWPERLGHIYSLQSGGDADQHQFAALAFQELQAAEDVRLGIPWHADTEDAGEQSDHDAVRNLLSRIHRLPELAKAAFDAGEFERACRYATELLETAQSDRLPEFFRNEGNAIFYGNLMLGRCALREGNVEQAKHFLLAAGRTKGSPNLGSFGPNMTLAKELLEQNHIDIVLEFFHLCRKFWKSGESDLGDWAADVRRGEIPDFGANLRY